MREYDHLSSSPDEGLPEPKTQPCDWSQQPQIPGFDEDEEVWEKGSLEIEKELPNSKDNQQESDNSGLIPDDNKLARGRAINENGRVFEKFLEKELGARGSFRVTSKINGTREFDGAVGNVWYEAKSGEYWNLLLSNEKKLAKFKSDMGKGLQITREYGVAYQLHSNTPIPEIIKKWLIKMEIRFIEWL